MISKFILIFILVLDQACLFGQESNVRDYMSEVPAAKDARMAWWRQARFGMFIHWGLYALPAGQWQGRESSGTGEWIMNSAQIPVTEYEKLAADFNPANFDADQWVQLAKNAGMKYIVITSKHHDGFCLWDSKVGDYDIVDSTPYKKDIIRALAEACKKYAVKFGCYYSIMDWHHPDYLPRRDWENRSADGADLQRYIAYMKAQLKELITEYDLDILWFDGEWESTWTHEAGVDLYNYVRSLKPDIIINNRVDTGRQGMQGMSKAGNFAGDFGTPEQEVPRHGLPGVDWESCMTMNDTWGYKMGDQNWKSAENLIQNLVDIVSKGGNYLLNVGPTSDGRIPAESVDRLATIGRWLAVNGEAVYGTGVYQAAKLEEQKVVMEKTEPFIDHDWQLAAPLDGISKDHFNATWTGTIVPRHTAEYTIETWSDDGVRLWLDDSLIIENWDNHGVEKDTVRVKLQAQKPYSVQLDYYENTGDAAIRLLWSEDSHDPEVMKAEQDFYAVYTSDKPKATQIYYTQKGDALYALTLTLPQELSLEMPAPDRKATVRILGLDKDLTWRYQDKKMVIDLSGIDRQDLPCPYAWVLRIR